MWPRVDRSGKRLMACRRWPLRSPALSADNDKRLERRVARAAEEALADHGFVSPIDVLRGLGWLHPSNVARWRRGRPACLEDVVFIEPARIATAIAVLQTWARARALEPSERPYPAGSRTPRELRYSARARKRYQRQGILVEEQALERAEAACLADDQAERAVASATGCGHRDTRSDELLMSGVERQAARAQVSDHVASTIDAWRIAPPAAKAPTPAAEHSYR